MYAALVLLLVAGVDAAADEAAVPVPLDVPPLLEGELVLLTLLRSALVAVALIPVMPAPPALVGVGLAVMVA